MSLRAINRIQRPIFLFSIIWLFGISLYATDTELYNGRYSCQYKDLTLGFRLSNAGVEDFVLNGRRYGSNISSYDFLGDFGGSQLFEVVIEKTDRQLVLLRLLLFHLDGRVRFISGFFARLHYPSRGAAEVKSHKTVEMHFEPEAH